MREQLGYRVKEVSDHDHRELSVQEVLEVFEDNYVNNAAPLNVTAAHYTQNQDGSISANPVSYTHLDVYKRQGLQGTDLHTAAAGHTG